MRLLNRLILVLFVLLNTGYVYSNWAFVARKDVQNFINDMVTHHQFDRKALTHTLVEAQFQPQIIASMDKPYEKKTWDVYERLFLTPQRLNAGLLFWQANEKALAQAERQFSVPASIIVAIIGVETLYGKNQGNYRVLDALTTLAFDYPKRSEFFTKELREYLLLCREHKVAATQYMGSYAGAMGKPQFMPSSYRFYAVNFTGQGSVDLINKDHDAISSVANYFHKHHWIMREPVAQKALIRGARYKQLRVNSKFADYSFKKLWASGVRPSQRTHNHPDKAGLIELFNQDTPEYWLAYPNFYVITRYNSSPQYALVVYLLAQQLEHQRLLARQSASMHVS